MKYEREFVADLACFMQGYVKEIRDHLIEEAETIYADPMLRKLLREHRIRVEKKNANFVRDLDNCLNLGLSSPEGESCLNHSGSYHDVLADLLVNEWWSEYCDEKRKGEAA